MPASKTLILTPENWTQYVHKLKQYPVRMSQLTKLNSSLTMGDLSLKYVVQGAELYHNGKEDFHLKRNHFLLGNNHQACEIKIDEGNIDTGLCIDLDINMFKEALASVIIPEELDDNNVRDWFLTADFFMTLNKASESLSQYLNQLTSSILKGNYEDSYRLEEVQAEILRHIVISQLPLIQSYYRIDAVKTTTRKELLRRLLIAKNYMDDHCGQDISIRDLSKICLIAEYRFYHLFKSVYKMSPYQYILEKKMNKAKELFKTGKYTWTEIAIITGYDNISSFSKAYKRFFGVSAQFDIPRPYN